MEIVRRGRGHNIIVKLGGKSEKHSLAKLPGLGSLAVKEEMRAFQYEFDLPFIAHLLKNAERLLFLAYSALREKGHHVDLNILLEAFSRYRRENTHIMREIGSRADHLAGHVRNAFAYLTACEEERAFDEMQIIMRASKDMRMFANEGQDRFQSMVELTTDIIEQLAGLHLSLSPNGKFISISDHKLSLLSRELAELCTFLVNHDGVRILRKITKDRLREAKDKYLDVHVTKAMETAERRGKNLAVMPLIFRDFSSTVTPAATALKGEGHDVRHVRPALENLAGFNDCCTLRLKLSAEHNLLTHAPAMRGEFKHVAIRSLTAALPFFQQIADVMQDLYEFCDELDSGYYLSLLPRFRIEAMLKQAQSRDAAERKKISTSLPVMRDAFMSMTRMRAIAKLCKAYCAAHKQEFPEKDSLTAFSAMSEVDRNVLNLSGVLGIALFETVSIAEARHKQLHQRKDHIIAAFEQT